MTLLVGNSYIHYQRPLERELLSKYYVKAVPAETDAGDVLVTANGGFW